MSLKSRKKIKTKNKKRSNQKKERKPSPKIKNGRKAVL